MKRLCLMRHAKSSWGNSDLADIDRPLNRRGLGDAPMMGKRLAANQLYVDSIVSSPATRALATARIIADKIGYKRDININENIYLAEPETLYEAIGQMDDSIETVMFFGHNPGFTSIANDIGDADIDNMPTCSIAIFDLNIDSWSQVAAHCGTLGYFDYPKNHRKT